MTTEDKDLVVWSSSVCLSRGSFLVSGGDTKNVRSHPAWGTFTHKKVIAEIG